MVLLTQQISGLYSYSLANFMNYTEKLEILMCELGWFSPGRSQLWYAGYIAIAIYSSEYQLTTSSRHWEILFSRTWQRLLALIRQAGGIRISEVRWRWFESTISVYISILSRHVDRNALRAPPHNSFYIAAVTACMWYTAIHATSKQVFASNILSYSNDQAVV